MTVTRPNGFQIPPEDGLLEEAGRLIRECAKGGVFAEPPVTEVEWKPSKKDEDTKKSGGDQNASGESAPDADGQ